MPTTKNRKPARVIVNCADYEGHKNVLFMMEESDSRLHDPESGYTLVTTGTYSKKVFTGTNNKRYQIFSDWSAVCMD